VKVHPSCVEFLARLERALEGRPAPAELSELSWHEHLLGCTDCRALLEREEALEVLLASLPRPELPPRVARRVLARLRRARAASVDLDALLDLDRLVEVPGGLAARVLRGLAAERGVAPVSERLERVLELDRALTVPAGLARRTLARLEPERFPAVARDGFRLLRSPLLYAAAAGLLLALFTWWGGGGGREGGAGNGSSEEVARASGDAASGAAGAAAGDAAGEQEPPAGLLEHFDLLAEDRLWDSDGDIELDLSLSLDVGDELLFDYDETSAAEAADGEGEKG